MPLSAFLFQRALQASQRIPNHSHLLFLFAVSSGGFVTYADAKSENDPKLPQVSTKKRIVVLGTGWAGISFLKNLNAYLYDVQVVSPRNYFTFTPLLPSVTCGMVEARSIVEPIRRIIRKKKGEVTFWDAECLKIDPFNKKIYCNPCAGSNVEGGGEFIVDYDYLVIAVGARVNTFNIPGVLEHCHFLKEIEDARDIRKNVMHCFERASLPNLNDEERQKDLHFVVIGGGPTGVEFAAQLHDFITEDLAGLYPQVKHLVKISLVEAGEHILTMFDKRITEFAEKKFRRDGIEVKTGFQVVNVSDKTITMTSKSAGEASVPYGMAVWSTGIATHPVILNLMKQIGQSERRVLAVDEWLRVCGCEDVYALGDCATTVQRKVMEDISAIFKMADKDNSGILTLKEIQDALKEIYLRYPQVELYMKTKHMTDVVDLVKEAKGEEAKVSAELNIEEFKKALANVDSQVKTLPATAQVAAQQGHYLAQCFNKMKETEDRPEGPIRIRESGRHRFKPFRYKHFAQFAPLGGEQTAAQLPGDWISIGHSTQWLWYSVYASKQVSWRSRMLVIMDWLKRFIYGRDSSCI
ncbi:NADH:ubiquinone reductase (non-electrogenic) protein [Dioscorea alata]|uniref:NADH:ubiquinone reductase (Non-electrogenic) protein n=1 Tax=Dioscorea alata TaxID=55571 RepID=A0ACB7W7J9_DIOAL|nr:NADH:ubiquinone reductase (non-electrogenic) protein [Dioscorea alata]